MTLEPIHRWIGPKSLPEHLIPFAAAPFAELVHMQDPGLPPLPLDQLLPRLPVYSMDNEVEDDEEVETGGADGALDPLSSAKASGPSTRSSPAQSSEHVSLRAIGPCARQ